MSEQLRDDEIYAITMDNAAYPECVSCLCRMCIYLMDICRICFLCEFEGFPRKYCRYFVPYVFRREPYRSYFKELEQLRGAKIDLFDFKG